MTDELQLGPTERVALYLREQNAAGSIDAPRRSRALAADIVALLREPAGDDADGALPEPLDFWADLTPRERKVWGAGYRKAEDDYHVRDLPTLLRLTGSLDVGAVQLLVDLLRTQLFTADEANAIHRLRDVVAHYNDEGTL